MISLLNNIMWNICGNADDYNKRKRAKTFLEQYAIVVTTQLLNDLIIQQGNDS